MKTKVKLSSPTKALDYLLLVIKINPKGILVNYMPKLEMGDFVDLVLRHGKHKISLKGSIHKVIDNQKGGKGTIVRFEKMTKNEIHQLSDFLNLIGENNLKIEAKTPVKAPSHQMTMVVSADSLSHLALESPDKKANFVPFTFDEEAVSFQKKSGLGGLTVIGHQSVTKPENKKGNTNTKLIKITFFTLLGICFLLLGLQWGGKVLTEFDPRAQTPKAKNKKPTQVQVIDPQPSPLPTRTPSKPKIVKKSAPKPKVKRTTRKRTTAKKSISKTISSFTVVESSAFFKISVNARSKIIKPKVSRSLSPTRALYFDFVGFSKKLKNSLKTVNKSPISKVRVQKLSGKTRLNVELNFPRFPRYDIQKYDTFVDIFIYKD